MPAAITLSHVTWSTPDGQRLFSNLDISFTSERTGLVGRNGVGKTTLLKLISGEILPSTGNVSVNARIGILRQTVRPPTHETLADIFGVRAALQTLRRADRGEAGAEELAEADWTLEARLADALGRVGLAATPDTPLRTFSGGQFTRVALAALIFAAPEFLLLDEPTNNLDRDGRRAIMDFLASWNRGAIVISHDRDLLEEMDAIVELTSFGAARYGGNWSAYRARKALERAAAQHDLADAKKEVAEVERQIQSAVERQARRDKVGRKKAARNDMPAVILGGLIENSQNTSAGHKRLADRKRIQAVAALAAARERVEVLQPLTIVIPPTHLAAGRTVLALEHVSAGYSKTTDVIRDLSFTIVGPERVAVCGRNGSGKTTLLSIITGQLRPRAGTVRVVPFALLDQQVGLLNPALSIRDNFKTLNPEADENACRAALARFMFRAEAALQPVRTLSGGQMLRAGLACVLGGNEPPRLLILDEPTNHLDLDAIEVIEAGLRAYDGALLVVSHDEIFLENIGITRRLELPERR